MSTKHVAAVIEIATAVIDTVYEAREHGAPGGVMYAALMSAGLSLESFEKLMALLIERNFVVKRGDCYFPGETTFEMKRVSRG